MHKSTMYVFFKFPFCIGIALLNFTVYLKEEKLWPIFMR